MLVALDLVDRPTTRRCVIAAVAGFVVIVFSQAAILVMAGIGDAIHVGARTMGRYLGTIGLRTDSIVMSGFEFTPVSADLYNLSDTTRLASAQAATFPVDALPDTVHPGCRDLRPLRRSAGPGGNAP